jgi:hypothetical protein
MYSSNITLLYYTCKALPVQKGGVTSNDDCSVCYEVYRMSNYCWSCSLLIEQRNINDKKETPNMLWSASLGFSHLMMYLSVC